MLTSLSELAYLAAWTAAGKLSERCTAPIFHAIAEIMWRCRGPGVRQLEVNLRHVMPLPLPPAKLALLVRAGIRSHLRYWSEFSQLPGWDVAHIKSRVRVMDRELLDSLIAQGRPVVLALPHMANWDLAGAWLAASGYPFTTVAQRLPSERLHQRFLASRRSLGMHVLPLSNSNSTSVYLTLARRLREGHIVCLVADRDVLGTGIKVRLLCQSAHLPGGPAMLAARNGAALMPVTLWYSRSQLNVQFHAEIAPPTQGPLGQRVTAMTQAVADVFAASITRHPQDRHVM